MKQQKNQITICGIGPGNKDYILPAVFAEVEKATVLVGGKRHLELFPHQNKETIIIDSSIHKVIERIQAVAGEHIVAIVSGDTGYYSFLRTVKEYLPDWHLSAIPGISSYQYLYARLGLSYENAYLGSVHGNECKIEELPDTFSSYFFLTDRKNDYRRLAEHFTNIERGQWKMHVGNRLSYNDETIWTDKVENFINRNEELELCSVIIEKQDQWQ